MNLNKVKKIQIITDDREKKGWTEKSLGSDFIVTRKRLKTGDYTIKGMEDLVCIEKKENWEEVLKNVSGKKDRERLKRMLRRIQAYPVRFFIVCDTLGRMENLDHWGKLSRGQVTRMLLNWWIEIPLVYGIPVLAIGKGNKANHLIAELFRRIVVYHKDGRLAYYKTKN